MTTHGRSDAGFFLIYVFVLMFAVALPALAHKGSDAYLDVRQAVEAAAPLSDTSAPAEQRAELAQGYRFVLSVALRDLDQVVAVDADGDARITWGELKRATPQLLALLDQTVSLGSGARDGASEPSTVRASGTDGAACSLRWKADGLERRSDGSYFRATAIARCAPADGVNLFYTLFGAQDANHRLLLAGRIDGVDLLTTASPQQTSALQLRAPGRNANGMTSVNAASDGWWATARDYFGLGMHHLLVGYDHLAFLLALVLPLRLKLQRAHPPARADVAAGPSSGQRANWLALLRTVTAFTLGHSLTLILATLGVTQASPAWVEPVIALSIVATAALNLRPVAGLRMEWLALAFGMVHGYGFAGLLQEASAPDGLLGWALIGFNLGVEVGQLMAVAAWVLLAQWLMTRRWYGPVVVRGGSVLLMGLGIAWFWQRIA